MGRINITPRQILWLKSLIHLLSLGWLGWTFYLALSDQLGADPVKALLHFTGMGAFNLLLLTLLVSPLAKGLKLGLLMRVRRLLGLYAFTYALAHFVSYLLFELQLAWFLLLDEIVKRPYITVGFVALLLLLSLALTSTQAIQRSMGKRWQQLHNWIYLSVCLVALHFIWSVKSDITEPVLYWLIIGWLLFFRRKKLLKLFKYSANKSV